MKIGIGQVTIILLLLFLLFGDFQATKKRLVSLIEKMSDLFQEKDRKKGI